MSFWDHVANPTKRISREEYLSAERRRVDKLMQLPADTSSRHVPEPKEFVYRLETIKSTQPQRPLQLEDEYISAHPYMAAALTAAHRLRIPFELLD